MPGPANHTNPGLSSVKGIFMHSAEGYCGTLLDPNSLWGFNGIHSWHITNCMNGRVVQHYPFTARCWHATTANQEYAAVENEGDYPREQSLNEPQIANAVRFISDIATWKGWAPSRPKTSTDKAYTLWEHTEVPLLGGSDSECPSGRIPWAEILRQLEGQPEEQEMIRFNGVAPSLSGKEIIGTTLWINAWTMFNLPSNASKVRIDIYLESGQLDVLDGRTAAFAGQVGYGGSRYGSVEAEISDGYFGLRGTAKLFQIGVTAYSS